MRKSGRYGIYHGKEYGVIRNMDGNQEIYTRDRDKIDSDFVDTYNSGTYSKVIQLEELEEYYEITTYAIWKDMKFLLNAETKEEYTLFTGDLNIAKEYDFEIHDRDCFTKNVRKDSVRIIEKRKDLK